MNIISSVLSFFYLLNCFTFLSDEGPSLITLDIVFRVSAVDQFVFVFFNTSYASHLLLQGRISHH